MGLADRGCWREEILAMPELYYRKDFLPVCGCEIGAESASQSHCPLEGPKAVKGVKLAGTL